MSKADDAAEGEYVVGFDGALTWLDELITSPWTDDKAERLTGIAILKQTLTAVGIDVESLVRYGLAEQISGTLIASLILDTTFPEELPNSLVETGRWRELLTIPLRGTSSVVSNEFTGLVARARPHIVAWVHAAPFAEILSYIPPTEDDLRRYRLHTELDDDQVAADYIWIWQRTRVEELHHWSDESLFKEFRWRNGDTNTPFPVAILEGIGPDSAALNQEIARRAAYASDQPVPLEDPLVWQMQSQALKLLSSNHPDEAAALFAFYLDHHPEHALARNNLGFCRIPTAPESALHHLRLAERAGYQFRAINMVNQCCCLTMLSREAEALDRAEYYWQRDFQADLVGGYLWVRGETGWTLTSEPNPNVYLARLAYDLSVALSRADRAKVWSERIDEIVSGWTAEVEGKPDAVA